MTDPLTLDGKFDDTFCTLGQLTVLGKLAKIRNEPHNTTHPTNNIPGPPSKYDPVNRASSFNASTFAQPTTTSHNDHHRLSMMTNIQLCFWIFFLTLTTSTSDALPLDLLKFLPLANIGNFNIPKIKGTKTLEQFKTAEDSATNCLPYASDIAVLLQSTCQTRTNTQTGYTWGRRIQQALSGDNEGIDFTGGITETCEHAVQKQACDKLSKSLATCDIMGAISTVMASMQAKQRCQTVSKLMNKSKSIGSSVGGLLVNEFAGSLFQKILG
ncbi:hypothetical protein T03_9214 [Trichinella britovi]|uniref:Uncharacterized protein n=1 Tax=Trichinella britovi TaxID=45882 RepID=A0A0V1CYE8_TRIBR|nr:hypothetical protein T03_9214 [Trichinella britovi]